MTKIENFVYAFIQKNDFLSEFPIRGHLADQIRDHFGNEYKGRRIWDALQKEQLGTFDALHAARAYLKGDPFLCLVGDDFYTKDDLEELILYDLAMLVMEKDYPGISISV